jgi:hypothetical protein
VIGFSLVDTMLSLHKRLAAEQLPRRREQMEREIGATDRQIDQLVYRLYGRARGRPRLSRRRWGEAGGKRAGHAAASGRRETPVAVSPAPAAQRPAQSADVRRQQGHRAARKLHFPAKRRHSLTQITPPAAPFSQSSAPSGYSAARFRQSPAPFKHSAAPST